MNLGRGKLLEDLVHWWAAGFTSIGTCILALVLNGGFANARGESEATLESRMLAYAYWPQGPAPASLQEGVKELYQSRSKEKHTHPIWIASKFSAPVFGAPGAAEMLGLVTWDREFPELSELLYVDNATGVIALMVPIYLLSLGIEAVCQRAGYMRTWKKLQPPPIKP